MINSKLKPGMVVKFSDQPDITGYIISINYYLYTCSISNVKEGWMKHTIPLKDLEISMDIPNATKIKQLSTFD